MYKMYTLTIGSGLNLHSKDAVQMRKCSHHTFNLASPPFLCVPEIIISIPEENNKMFHQEGIF